MPPDHEKLSLWSLSGAFSRFVVDPRGDCRGSETPELAHLNSADLSAMDKPLQGSRMYLEQCRRLVAVEQGFSVELGKLFSRRFTGRWLFLVWHGGPFR